VVEAGELNYAWVLKTCKLLNPVAHLAYRYYRSHVCRINLDQWLHIGFPRPRAATRWLYEGVGRSVLITATAYLRVRDDHAIVLANPGNGAFLQRTHRL